MNQEKIGRFISDLRKEKNMTQLELANKLGITDRAISKWENGKCMPDYSVIEQLCHELDITLAELLDGEEKEPNSIRIYDDEQVNSLLCKMQKMEKHYKYALGAIMIIIGCISFIISSLFSGSNFRDFVSGILFGFGLSGIVVGIISVVMSFRKGQ